MRRAVAGLALAGALSVPFSAPAQNRTVEIRDAWIRGTVAGQTASGAFMEITSPTTARLVSVTSPVAASAEIHRMKLENGIMRMFPVDGVDLPAGRTVKLAPGGFHVMLTGLRRPLKAGDQVPLKLTFERGGGLRETADLQVRVRALTGGNPHGH